MVLLGACAAADVFSIYAGSRLRTLVTDAGFLLWYGDMEHLEQADALFGLSGILQLAALLAAAAAFLVWFHRSRVNAEVFDAGSQRMKRGWVIGGWFVPVVNFWFPKKIANDIWNASSLRGPDGALPERAPLGILNAWWLLWVVALLLDRPAARRYERAETPEEIVDALAFHSFTDAIGVLAAVLAICFVARLTSMQHAFQTHHQACVPGASAAP